MSMPLGISRIYLIGLMGAGKSTVGKILARTLDWKLFDIDHEIEASTGSDIPTIFESEGEDGFRDYESQVLLQTAPLDKAIIPCGGGIVIREENVEFLSDEVAIWLDLPPAEAAARLEHSDNRPLLEECNDTLNKLTEILVARSESYAKAAKIRINSGDRSPEIIASEILKELEMQDG